MNVFAPIAVGLGREKWSPGPEAMLSPGAIHSPGVSSGSVVGDDAIDRFRQRRNGTEDSRPVIRNPYPSFAQ